MDEVQSWNWCRTTNGEDQCIAGNMQGVRSGAIVEGIHRRFCMDVQRYERDSIRASTAQNWIGHYYTIDTSG
jgi:hypothetical protein